MKKSYYSYEAHTVKWSLWRNTNIDFMKTDYNMMYIWMNKPGMHWFFSFDVGTDPANAKFE